MRSQLGLFDSPPPSRRRAAALRSFHARHQPVTVDEALEGERKAERQEDLILDWFRYQPPGARFTPSEVHAVFLAHGWPITSVRRALTNLSSGETPPLEHHPADRRSGPLGAKESTWSLRR